MEISYKNSIYDVISFKIYTSLREPIYPIILILFAIYWAHDLIDYSRAKEHLYVYLFTVLFFLLEFIIILIFWLLILSVITSVLRKDKAFNTEHRIIINEEGLIEETKYNKSEYKWNGLYRLRQTKKYLIIYVTHWSAHIIPRSCFIDKNQEKEFYDYCIQKLSENKER